MNNEQWTMNNEQWTMNNEQWTMNSMTTKQSVVIQYDNNLWLGPKKVKIFFLSTFNVNNQINSSKYNCALTVCTYSDNIPDIFKNKYDLKNCIIFS